MLETLKVRSVTQADKKYSVLISFPPPFNLILLFVAPFLMTSRDPEAMNQKLLMIAYFPILIISILTFIAGEVLMWPLVYAKMVFHKLTMVWVYSKSFRVSRADKFSNLIKYVIMGPFTTVGTSFVDTYYFIRHLVRQDLQKFKHKTRHFDIKKENMKLVEQLFNEKQEKIIDFKTFARKLRSDMGIEELIRDSIFPYSLTRVSQDPTAVPSLRKSLENMDRLGQASKPGGLQRYLHKHDEDRLAADLLEARRQKMVNKIKEYTVLKEILDHNCQMLGVSHDSLKSYVQEFEQLDSEVQQRITINKFKTIDCKLVHNAL